MRYWTRKALADGEKVPGKVRRIAEALQEASEDRVGDGPRLLRIGRHDRDDDCYRWEVDVELAPGIVLPTEHDLVGSLEMGGEDPWDDQAPVLKCAMERVDACLPDLVACPTSCTPYDCVHGQRSPLGKRRPADPRRRRRPCALRQLAQPEHALDQGVLDSLDERLEPEIQVVGTGPDRSLARLWPSSATCSSIAPDVALN